MKIYNLGSLNIDYVYSVDHFVAAGETLSSDRLDTFPGGKGLNQSIALARAGATVIHGGILGENGAFLKERLKDSLVDVSKIKTVKSNSGHAIIQVDKNGQNCILLFAGSNHLIDDAYIEEFLKDAEAGDVLLLQNEISGLATAFDCANAKKMQIAFNPSPYRDELKQLPLNTVKWFFCNEIEGEALFGSSDPEKMVESFLSQYPESVLILTLGSAGSMYADKEKTFFQPSFKVKAVDTTAAGDTFTGYFLSEIAKGSTPETATETAAKASSVTVSRKGASDSIPCFSELTD